MNTPDPLKLEDLKEPSDVQFVLVGLAIFAAFFVGYAFGART